VFVLMVPESPKYLFMKNPKSQKAINIMNYISKFNGCKMRISPEGIMDTEGQNKQDAELLQKKSRTSRTSMGSLHHKSKNDGMIKNACRDLGTLFCGKIHRKN
jgi:hypothetical protein